ncbi:MAG: hypothetical protein L0Z07_05050 [Planctomycetes bacterium]|nr:hypothetical protein [Planctomycetota bacterium]
MGNSGKLLILAMVVVGLLAAGASWWFRYSATHQAARFWGPEAVRLIRDAPRVELVRLPPNGGAGDRQAAAALRRDVSAAPGMTHLRNALLEDRSFLWPPEQRNQDPVWRWAIRFHQTGTAASATLLFTDDCCQTNLSDGDHRGVASCEPIAAGLHQVFAGWMRGEEADSPGRRAVLSMIGDSIAGCAIVWTRPTGSL